MSPPLLLVIAGPNGAGKSTFYDEYLSGLGLYYVNADLISGRFGIEPYDAAQVADAVRSILMRAGNTFCMETVFSDPDGDKLELLRTAKAAGYEVVIVFIGLDSPELSVARVAQRVAEGGHDVPDEKLHARYPRTFQNLSRAIEIADVIYVFDNSSADDPYRFVAIFEEGEFMGSASQWPDWADKIFLLLDPNF